jgi:uncharacterized membrane protein YdjX (TVP38/TMEM64 family)
MLGSLLAATAAFFLSRVMGRDFVQKMLGKRADYMNNKAGNYGIGIIASIRVSFVVPFDVLSYLAGLVKMRYRDFIIGTFLGILPEVLSLSYLGGKLKHPRSKFMFAIISIVLLLSSYSLFKI